jgi:hypothetical protein
MEARARPQRADAEFGSKGPACATNLERDMVTRCDRCYRYLVVIVH